MSPAGAAEEEVTRREEGRQIGRGRRRGRWTCRKERMRRIGREGMEEDRGKEYGDVCGAEVWLLLIVVAGVR